MNRARFDRDEAWKRLEAHSIAAYVNSYVIVALLLFFAVGGTLPSRYSSASSLDATISDAYTVLGTGFQAFFWMICAFWMTRHFKAIVDSGRRMKAVLALSLVAPLSALWSQNPIISLRRGTFLVLGTLFAFSLVRTYPAEKLGELIVLAGVAAGLLGIFTCILFPQIGLDAGNGGAWEGIFHAKNACAQVMLFFLTPAVSFKFRSRTMSFVRYLLFLVAFVLILMANAKTTWILCPGYILLIGVATKLKRFARRDATMLAVVLVSTVVGLAVMIPAVLPTVLPFMGKDPSISGRIPLWGATLVAILKRPLLGYGFAAFWTGFQGESLNVFMSTHFEIHQAQNGLLELGLELGLVGVCLFVLSLLKAFRDAVICFQNAHSDVTNWYVGLLFLTVSYNVGEAFLAHENFLPWLLYLIACTGLAEEARRTLAAKSLIDSSTNKSARLISAFTRSA
jgi:exopolysaccharide production protein ExoQ